MSCGYAHTGVVMSNGEAYTWWRGDFGALGFGTDESQWFPVKLRFPNEPSQVTLMQIDCGAKHTAVLDRSGRCFTFGCGEQGQLGTGYIHNQYTPMMVDLEVVERNQHNGLLEDSLKGDDKLVIQVACGDEHTLLRTQSGQILAMGYNGYG